MPGSAVKAFEGLRPLRDHVIHLSTAHFPQSEDWRALHQIVEAVDEAARHFGLDPHKLYSSGDIGPIGSGWKP